MQLLLFLFCNKFVCVAYKIGKWGKMWKLRHIEIRPIKKILIIRKSEGNSRIFHFLVVALVTERKRRHALQYLKIILSEKQLIYFKRVLWDQRILKIFYYRHTIPKEILWRRLWLRICEHGSPIWPKGLREKNIIATPHPATRSHSQAEATLSCLLFSVVRLLLKEYIVACRNIKHQKRIIQTCDGKSRTFIPLLLFSFHCNFLFHLFVIF